jgi:hypothetical protein
MEHNILELLIHTVSQLRFSEKLVVSSTLLCSGLGGVRILHQIGLFGEIANKLRQGWKFFEIRPKFARKLVDVEAQLVKDLSGIVTTQHFFFSCLRHYIFF